MAKRKAKTPPRRAADVIPTDREYLTEREAAALLRRQPQTLSNWRTQGIGPTYSKFGTGKRGRVLYTRKALAAFIEAHERTATTDPVPRPRRPSEPAARATRPSDLVGLATTPSAAPAEPAAVGSPAGPTDPPSKRPRGRPARVPEAR